MREPAYEPSPQVKPVMHSPSDIKLINSFMGHAHLRIVRMISFESSTDLSGGPLVFQSFVHRVMQPG